MSANDELQAHTCEKILQECGDVANNVVQPKVQDLTEQWKKGELPDGLYYCKLACFNYEPTIAKCKSGCIGLASFSKNEEVLAPVPSYVEWKNVTTCFDYEHKAYLSMVEENQQLKEVITKICTELVDDDDDMSFGLAEYFSQELLLEIREVLK